MKRYYTFEETVALDKKLQKLAIYEVSGGEIIIPDSHEDIFDFEIECAEKFNYLKSLVKRGECTIEYLEDTIMFNNGPYNQNNEYIDTPEELIEEIEASDERRNKEKEVIGSFYDAVTGLLGKTSYDSFTTNTTTTLEEDKNEDINGSCEDFDDADGQYDYEY